MKIYRTTDRVSIKIHDTVFEFSPLTVQQKAEVTSRLSNIDRNNPTAAASQVFDAQKLAIKQTLKAVNGVSYADGTAFELELDANGAITDECADALLNCEYSNELSLACLSFLNGVPKDITDPTTGKKLEGVTVLSKPSKK